MPSADTEMTALALAGIGHRLKVDLDQVTQFRLVAYVQTAGAAGADLRVQDSSDQSAWNNLDGSAGPELGIAAAGIQDTGWVNVRAAAKTTDRFLRIMGKDGNGTLDPRFSLHLFFK